MTLQAGAEGRSLHWFGRGTPSVTARDRRLAVALAPVSILPGARNLGDLNAHTLSFSDSRNPDTAAPIGFIGPSDPGLAGSRPRPGAIGCMRLSIVYDSGTTVGQAFPAYPTPVERTLLVHPLWSNSGATSSSSRLHPAMIVRGSFSERRVTHSFWKDHLRGLTVSQSLASSAQAGLAPWSVGVCSWSLQVKSVPELKRLLDQLGINVVQIACGDPHHASWEEGDGMPAAARASGILMTGAMLGFPGEDYTTPADDQGDRRLRQARLARRADRAAQVGARPDPGPGPLRPDAARGLPARARRSRAGRPCSTPWPRPASSPRTRG